MHSATEAVVQHAEPSGCSRSVAPCWSKQLRRRTLRHEPAIEGGGERAGAAGGGSGSGGEGGGKGGGEDGGEAAAGGGAEGGGGEGCSGDGGGGGREGSSEDGSGGGGTAVLSTARHHCCCSCSDAWCGGERGGRLGGAGRASSKLADAALRAGALLSHKTGAKSRAAAAQKADSNGLARATRDGSCAGAGCSGSSVITWS